MSIDDLNYNELNSMGNEIRARREDIKPITPLYGSDENLSKSDTELREAMIKYQNGQIKPITQLYGSAENLSKSDTEIREAQVAEKRMQEKPFNEYLNDLVLNPTITDDTVFENVIIKGMQSKQILKQFMENLTTKINTEIFKIRNIDNSDKLSIENSKNNIEKLVAVYQKALYTLKKYNYNFNTYDTGLDTMKLSDETISQLWQLERNKGISFKIPIPANLGEYYGKEYTRDGKMVAGLRLMHDNLLGKEVNWHQILNYKEGELTPAQLYKKRQQEKFEQARKQELQTLSLNLNKDNLNRETQEESLESTRGVR